MRQRSNLSGFQRKKHFTSGVPITGRWISTSAVSAVRPLYKWGSSYCGNGIISEVFGGNTTLQVDIHNGAMDINGNGFNGKPLYKWGRYIEAAE